VRVAGIVNGSIEGRPQSLVIRAPRVLARVSGQQDTARSMESEHLKVYCGIDWAEKHVRHDIALVDADGSWWPSGASRKPLRVSRS